MPNSERGPIDEIRAWIAYAIHPDTNLLWTRGEETDFKDVVEQSRQMEFAVREAEEMAMSEPNRDPNSVIRVAREWDRLKQRLGVETDE